MAYNSVVSAIDDRYLELCCEAGLHWFIDQECPSLGMRRGVFGLVEITTSKSTDMIIQGQFQDPGTLIFY